MASRMISLIGLLLLCLGFFLPLVPGHRETGVHIVLPVLRGGAHWTWLPVCGFILFPLLALPAVVFQRCLHGSRVRTALWIVFFGICVVSVGGLGYWRIHMLEEWTIQIRQLPHMRHYHHGAATLILAVGSILLAGVAVPIWFVPTSRAVFRVPITLLFYGLAGVLFYGLAQFVSGVAFGHWVCLVGSVLVSIGALTEIILIVRVRRQGAEGGALTSP